MACNSLSFSVDRSALAGKQGILKPDKDGYYELLAGAYNLANSVGERYVFNDEVKSLFVHSRMITKLKEGQLYGEIGHPDLDVYRSKTRTEADAVALWMLRLARIDQSNEAFHSTGVRWQEMPDKIDGRTVYAVYLKLKPSAPGMIESIKNPNINTALSVRSFINRTFAMGEFLCTTKDIVTYDWVPHGGIKLATKYNSPGLEDDSSILLPEKPQIYTSDSVEMTPELCDRMDELNTCGLVGMEAGEMFNTRMIRNMAGNWQEVQDLGNLVSRRW